MSVILYYIFVFIYRYVNRTQVAEDWGFLNSFKVGFPTQVDFTCAQVNLIARNFAIIARNKRKGIAFYFLAFVFKFFENFQLKPYGKQ